MSQERKQLPVRFKDLLSRSDVERMREFFGGLEADRMVYDEIESLRQEVEPLEAWIKTKEAAKRELEEVPSNIFELLFVRLAPYIETLPAGHGKGHLLRDTINLSLILQAPDTYHYDPVEVVAGALAGTFHDIGNSLVDRYDEPKRFAGHAEVGAYLFGEIAKDIVPPNLLKLTQLAITGHTHYTREISVTRNRETRIKRPYEDEIVDGHKIAIWMARWTDRLDIQAEAHTARHILTKYEPTMDFDGKEFQPVWQNEEDDFKHQFIPERRSRDFIDSLPKDSPERGQRVLEHLVMFAESSFNKKLPYPKYDTEHYTWRLMAPRALRQAQFIRAVEATPPAYSKEDREERINRFLAICKILEPAQNIDEIIETLRDKFSLLPEEQQNQWAHGFEVYTGLCSQWYKEVETRLKEKPLMTKPKLQEIVNNLHQIAVHTLPIFAPVRIED